MQSYIVHCVARGARSNSFRSPPTTTFRIRQNFGSVVVMNDSSSHRHSFVAFRPRWMSSSAAADSTIKKSNKTSATTSSSELDLNLTPSQVVAGLDRHIVGQHDAKRAVAIAMRNRWRRKQLSDELRKEVTPRNVLLVGPTGCGKTEGA